ncbi:MAG: hypothetical protein QOF70_3093, partial [Acetobacteraceae bacterium]|nr:hypothetical protein [Acetobacteraceae bacterium]
TSHLQNMENSADNLAVALRFHAAPILEERLRRGTAHRRLVHDLDDMLPDYIY